MGKPTATAAAVFAKSASAPPITSSSTPTGTFASSWTRTPAFSTTATTPRIRGSTECLPRAITRITGITATATTTNTITTATATSTAATATATATATAQTSTQQEAKIFYGNLSSIVQRLEAAFGALKEGKSIEEAEGIMKEVFEK
ncbi:hypothetical protein FRC14_002883 [Serendipita sp. 396]|nr:hypothetical protein FRC14_002883 [Serendipita sp. 396]